MYDLTRSSSVAASSASFALRSVVLRWCDDLGLEVLDQGFDFDVPADRSVTETVTLLARMARFVIADLTDPRSLPQELQAIVPHLPSVPVQPIIVAGQKPWAMFPDLEDYPWMLEPYPYDDEEALIENLEAKVIGPPDDYRKARDAKRKALMESAEESE